MPVADDLKDMASSNVGIGALGGAGLGLLLQAIRPKDKDQKAWKEYLMSALLGAGLGAASGFAYDQLLAPGYDAGAARNPPKGNVTRSRGKTMDNYNVLIDGNHDYYQRVWDSMTPEEKAALVVFDLGQIGDHVAWDDKGLIDGDSWLDDEFTNQRFPDRPRAEVSRLIEYGKHGGAVRIAGGDIYGLGKFKPDNYDGWVLLQTREPLWRHPGNRK